MTIFTPIPASTVAVDPKRLAGAVERATEALLSLQHADGHWCGELQGDSILESEYILMKFILQQEHEPMADGSDGWRTLEKIANYLRSLQRTDGGWGQYPGSPIDISATVKAYFALKLMGDPPTAPHMEAAREAILTGGGAEQCNSFSKFYLACLGQVPYTAVPAIPPEIIYLPKWSYFHLSKVSAWTRTMILPLSLVVTLRPVRKLPREMGIDELFVDERMRGKLAGTVDAPYPWAAFFRGVDQALKAAHLIGGTPLRKAAIKRCEEWILTRAGQDGEASTDGLGAIFPPMVYLQIAFRALGYERDHPVIQRAERELDAFFIEDETNETIRIQPCFSPVWDSGIALYALTDCGRSMKNDSEDSAIARACEWLVSKECTHAGDWVDNAPPGTTPAGWYFEYNNAWYPDCDDTAMVAMALRRAAVQSPLPQREGLRELVEASEVHSDSNVAPCADAQTPSPALLLEGGGSDAIAAAHRGVAWLLAMQNDDGGWAAFDRTAHRQILEYIPFADHNAMQDPSCPDITGRVLECLALHGSTIDDAPVARAVEYIKTRQEPEGCWFGRWGVNYIYGTWQAVIGPIRCGVDRDEPWIRRAGAWMKSIQKDDGSFGESANSYLEADLKGAGPSTASQTAWAAMVLQEVYGPDDPDLARAVNWLIGTQLTKRDAADAALNPDGDPAGSWRELEFTGTGFPRVFYLRYHLYRLYFPLMALGRYQQAQRIAAAPGTSFRQSNR